jgi:hypothetical protein
VEASFQGFLGGGGEFRPVGVSDDAHFRILPWACRASIAAVYATSASNTCSNTNRPSTASTRMMSFGVKWTDKISFASGFSIYCRRWVRRSMPGYHMEDKLLKIPSWD